MHWKSKSKSPRLVLGLVVPVLQTSLQQIQHLYVAFTCLLFVRLIFQCLWNSLFVLPVRVGAVKLQGGLTDHLQLEFQILLAGLGQLSHVSCHIHRILLLLLRLMRGNSSPFPAFRHLRQLLFLFILAMTIQLNTQPWMTQHLNNSKMYLWGSDPLVGVYLEHSSDKVENVSWKVKLLTGVLSIVDFFVELLVGSAFKWKYSSQSNEGKNSKSPDISGFTSVLLLLNNLGSHVAGSSTKDLDLNNTKYTFLCFSMQVLKPKSIRLGDRS